MLGAKPRPREQLVASSPWPLRGFHCLIVPHAKTLPGGSYKCPVLDSPGVLTPVLVLLILKRPLLLSPSRYLSGDGNCEVIGSRRKD